MGQMSINVGVIETVPEVYTKENHLLSCNEDHKTEKDTLKFHSNILECSKSVHNAGVADAVKEPQGERQNILKIAHYLDCKIQGPALHIHYTALYTEQITSNCPCCRLIHIALGYFYLTGQEVCCFSANSDCNRML